MDALAQRLQDLQVFLPLHCFNEVLFYFRKYPIHLTITRNRKGRLGDYGAPRSGQKVHHISVNGNLNPYAFLITLLHEIAHLLVYEKHQRKVKPHGPEWKTAFGLLLTDFADKGVFPETLEAVIRKSALSPASATFRDVALSRALRVYDEKGKAFLMAADLAPGAVFRSADNQVYEVLERRRSQIRCRRLKDGREYLVPFASEVEIIPPSS